MWPDRVSNPGPLTYESDVPPTALRPQQGEKRLTEKAYADIEIISIFHGCMMWIEKSATRVSDRHHQACRVMPKCDPQ